MSTPKPVVLCILDGWGLRQEREANAPVLADTPTYDRIMATCPHATLITHGPDVGLPSGQMGNSEVGHLNLGAGFIVYQNITRIDNAIRESTLALNPLLMQTLQECKTAGRPVHFMGLISSGGVHSHTRHLNALLEIAHEQGVESVVHVITDGRDTPPNSGKEFVGELETSLAEKKLGRIGSISGRYFAMDRDKRWDRVQKAYNAIVNRVGTSFHSAVALIEDAYAQDVTDEFIIPGLVGAADDASLRIQDGDCVICFNFRADRARRQR